jgi:hypothetical protein
MIFDYKLILYYYIIRAL